ncbi:MAG: hypothetical protein VYC34_09050 [Planctomycetota bacterium]|nr:hypothetical protein [Planctomycetota bacterium]
MRRDAADIFGVTVFVAAGVAGVIAPVKRGKREKKAGRPAGRFRALL